MLSWQQSYFVGEYLSYLIFIKINQYFTLKVEYYNNDPKKVHLIFSKDS